MFTELILTSSAKTDAKTAMAAKSFILSEKYDRYLNGKVFFLLFKLFPKNVGSFTRILMFGYVAFRGFPIQLVTSSCAA